MRKKPIAAMLIGLLLLLGAGGGFLWYRNRPAPTVVPAVVTTQPSQAAEQVPPPEVHEPKVQRPAGKKGGLAPAPVIPQIKPTKTAELKKPPIASPTQVLPPPPAAPTKEPSAPPATLAAANPTSGVLHCPGNPVHQGETVEFPNQPKERRRYSYDQNAWKLYNRNGLDGTKTLVLESKLPGVQTSCTVSWQLAR